jgi:hypothetical protein
LDTLFVVASDQNLAGRGKKVQKFLQHLLPIPGRRKKTCTLSRARGGRHKNFAALREVNKIDEVKCTVKITQLGGLLL